MQKKKPTQIKKKMSDNIEEYFTKVEGTKEAFHSRELLTADLDNVDLKTDLSHQEITFVNMILFNDNLLRSKGLKPLFTGYINKYMRLKFSLDRKSRMEFVNINKSDKTDDALKIASDISNITKTKK